MFPKNSTLAILAFSAASLRAWSLSSSDKTRVNFVINDDGGGFSRIFPDFTRFSDLGVSVDVFLSVLI